MFKPALNAVGCLMGNISAGANVLPIDAVSAGVLAAILADPTDWTYLQIGIAPSSEVVKVTAIEATAITVTRAIDGTAALAYPTLTEISYVLSAAAVADIVQENAFVEVQLNAEAPLIVTPNGANDFTLSLDPLNLYSNNGSINVVGAWPDIDIDIDPTFNGCCS